MTRAQARVYCNAGAERLFGYSAREALGQPITLLIPPDRLEEEPTVLARIRRGERLEHYETVRLRKDGTLVDISLTVSPLKDSQGQVTGASKIARDITVAKRGEKALRESEQRFRDLGENIAQLAWMADAQGWVFWYNKRWYEYIALGPASSEHLSRVSSAAKRLGRLMEDVLALSRLPRWQVELARVDVDRLVREIIRERPELQPPASEVSIAGPLPAMRGHEVLLTQCLTNLLGNAVKFVPPRVVPQVRVYSEPSGKKVRLWVADNGIGIEQDARSKIFEAFQRGVAAAEYEGTGIGLAIVRKAAQRMGGEVGLESEPGKGSRFWLELARAD